MKSTNAVKGLIRLTGALLVSGSDRQDLARARGQVGTEVPLVETEVARTAIATEK